MEDVGQMGWQMNTEWRMEDGDYRMKDKDTRIVDEDKIRMKDGDYGMADECRIEDGGW